MISLGRQSRAALFLTIAGAVSCSVKEDRSVCPCYVTLDFAPAVEAGLGDASLLVGNRSGMVVEDVDISSLVDGTLEVAVPRGRTGFSAVFGEEGYDLHGDTLHYLSERYKTIDTGRNMRRAMTTPIPAVCSRISSSVT